MDPVFTETYCQWFEGLPPELARDLAVSLARMAPAGLLESSLITADPLDGFAARIRRLATDRVRDAGTALTLAALTDFTFFERGNPTSWAKNEEMLDVLDEAQQALYGEGDAVSSEISEWIEQNRLRYPLRSRQWMKAEGGWRILRDGDLSPTAIHARLGEAPV